MNCLTSLAPVLVILIDYETRAVTLMRGQGVTKQTADLPLVHLSRGSEDRILPYGAVPPHRDDGMLSRRIPAKITSEYRSCQHQLERFDASMAW